MTRPRLHAAGDDAARSWLEARWRDAPTRFFVDVDGARIACRGWNLDARHLPGIVLVHGFRAHAAWWDHIGPALVAGHRVVALSFSGMGDSDRRAIYTRAQHGREVAAVADACGFAPAVVVAHSYGGIAAMTAARADPDRFRRLIVVDSALPTPGDADGDIPTQPLRVYPSEAAALARFRLHPPGEWPQPEVLAYIARHSIVATDGGWTWKFDNAAAASLNQEQDRRDALIGVRTPADFIYGELSEIVTAQRLAEVPTLLPTVTSPIAVPACHHHVMIEQPLALVALLRGLVNL